MGDPRPTSVDLGDQAAHLTETGNGPTLANEQDVLRTEFGAPDERGVYGAPASQGGAA
ncbi:hypothetical protein [Saccharothrix sp. ST-888]|uniref:hypothetical protein n=1 Tax=Saccharothrix sp. ST-888 TaxID=1427391 RepID=UPI000B20FC2A|nr:hypothetical protein [Saccharothrix sp. ST-888]